MNKLQLIKIALLTALLVEEVRNARKIKNYKVRMEITNLNELKKTLNETKEKLKESTPNLNQV
ncbi:hypothetical protein IM156_00265 [Staphylococcus epidermidis]|nr:hypothetical protein [Staphylococcus epidermidis]